MPSRRRVIDISDLISPSADADTAILPQWGVNIGSASLRTMICADQNRAPGSLWLDAMTVFSAGGVLYLRNLAMTGHLRDFLRHRTTAFDVKMDAAVTSPLIGAVIKASKPDRTARNGACEPAITGIVLILTFAVTGAGFGPTPQVPQRKADKDTLSLRGHPRIASQPGAKCFSVPDKAILQR